MLPNSGRPSSAAAVERSSACDRLQRWLIQDQLAARVSAVQQRFAIVERETAASQAATEELFRLADAHMRSEWSDALDATFREERSEELLYAEELERTALRKIIQHADGGRAAQRFYQSNTSMGVAKGPPRPASATSPWGALSVAERVRTRARPMSGSGAREMRRPPAGKAPAASWATVVVASPTGVDSQSEWGSRPGTAASAASQVRPLSASEMATRSDAYWNALYRASRVSSASTARPAQRVDVLDLSSEADDSPRWEAAANCDATNDSLDTVAAHSTSALRRAERASSARGLICADPAVVRAAARHSKESSRRTVAAASAGFPPRAHSAGVRRSRGQALARASVSRLHDALARAEACAVVTSPAIDDTAVDDSTTVTEDRRASPAMATDPEPSAATAVRLDTGREAPTEIEETREPSPSESARDLSARMKSRLLSAVEASYDSSAPTDTHQLPSKHLVPNASADVGSLVLATGGGRADAAEVTALHATLGDLDAVLAMPRQQEEVPHTAIAQEVCKANQSWARQIWRQDTDGLGRLGHTQRDLTEPAADSAPVDQVPDPRKAQAAVRGWLARRNLRAARACRQHQTSVPNPTADEAQERRAAARMIQRAFKCRPGRATFDSSALGRDRLSAEAAAHRIQRLFRVWCLGRRVSVLAKQGRSHRQKALFDDAARAVQRSCRRASARRSASKRVPTDADSAAPEAAERAFAAVQIQLWWRGITLTRRAGAISRDARVVRLGVVRSEAAETIQRALRRRVGSPHRSQ